VKKVAKFFAYTLFFVVALMAFIPKASVYYLAEENLKTFDIVVSKESLVESLFSLDVKNLDISAKGVESAYVNSVTFTFLGLYNGMTFKQIKLSSIVEAYLPSKIKLVTVEYSLLHPLSIEIGSLGEFGILNARFDLLELKLNATLKPSKLLLEKYSSSLRFFKKSQDGEYIYEKAI
jgi:hypothetical protein